MAHPSGRNADTAEHTSLKVERAGPPANTNTNAPTLVACARIVSSKAKAELVATATPKGVTASSSGDGGDFRAEARREQSPHVHSKAHSSLEAWAWTRGQQERQRACRALSVAPRASRLAETGDDF